MMLANQLHWSDWLVFAVMLLISLGIGVYHSLTGGKQRTTGEYLLGNRQMGVIPVTLSMTVSYISTLTLLGYPAEMYAFGAAYLVSIIGAVLGAIGACLVFVPLFYPLKLTSANEYLQLRYESRLVKSIGSFFTVTGTMFFSGNALFGPSTAIEAVSGFSVHACIAVGSIVCIIYTSIGGIKAVIWTDVFQSFIMLAGAVLILIQGLIAIDGMDKIWEYCSVWGRLEIFDFDPNPTKRLTFWGMIIGQSFSFIGIYGYIQVAVQRYSSLPTITKARISVLGAMPGMVVLSSLACFIGLVVFAYYAQTGCDPIAAGYINSPNQILPYFIVEVGSLPLVSGLFIASMSAASLSSASSGMSSAAANLWADLIHPCIPNVKPNTATKITKLLVLSLGVTSMLIAFGIASAGGTMLQIMGTFSSAVGGPAAALYFMGAFLPWVNWKGATAGSFAGFALGLWITIGSYTSGKNWLPLPTPTANCTIDDVLQLPGNYTLLYAEAEGLMTTATSLVTSATLPIPVNNVTGIKTLFQLSWLWMREFIMFFTIFISVIVSAITGFTNPANINPCYLHPWTVGLLALKPDAIDDNNVKVPLQTSDANIIQEDDKKCDLLHKMTVQNES